MLEYLLKQKQNKLGFCNLKETFQQVKQHKTKQKQETHKSKTNKGAKGRKGAHTQEHKQLRLCEEK